VEHFVLALFYATHPVSLHVASIDEKCELHETSCDGATKLELIGSCSVRSPALLRGFVAHVGTLLAICGCSFDQ